MFELPHDLGDYILHEELDSEFSYQVFRAEQKGTGRHVVLELVSETSATPEEIESFLEEARVKTKVSEQLPFMGTVFEVQKKDGYIFFTYQQLEGESLEEKTADGEKPGIDVLLNILEMLSRAFYIFDSLNVAVRPLELKDIKVKDNGHVSMENIAHAGVRQESAAAEEMRHAGEVLAPIVKEGVPGSTRMATLLDWMANGANGETLAWEQVYDLVATVRDQLGLVPSGVVSFGKPTKFSKNTVKIMLGAAVLIVLAVIITCTKNGESEQPVPGVPEKVPQLSYRDHTDVLLTLPDSGEQISCDAHEVTIKAYKRFLDSLSRLPAEVVARDYSHPGQPEDKTSYIPDDWDEIYAAAEKNETWNGMKLSLSSPVFNVDWWDAQAYAKWKGRRLPTKDEWLAIAKISGIDGKKDAYGSVEDYRNDVGDDNLCGFSSGVSEWTDTLEKNNDQPMEAEQYVVCGGNYEAAGSQKISYKATPGVRSHTLGFRTVSTPTNKD